MRSPVGLGSEEGRIYSLVCRRGRPGIGVSCSHSMPGVGWGVVDEVGRGMGPAAEHGAGHVFGQPEGENNFSLSRWDP